MSQRKLILYISTSLDGFIAKKNDDLSFLDKMQLPGEDYGYVEFNSTIDTVIVGRRTYEWVLNKGFEFAHKDKESYIITRTPRDKEGNITFYSGDLTELVNGLKNKTGKNIYCDGGAQIVHELLKGKLIDEIILSMIPVLLGDGIRLFNNERPEQELTLLSSKKYDSGLVQLHYEIQKTI